MEPLTKPLFRFDPGWLFIMAGVVICAAGVILPAQNDLEALRRQLDQLRSEETLAYDRLKAHGNFLDQVDRSDPALVRRLAATQLNMVPEGDKPILLARADASPVTDWIEGTVQKDLRPPRVVGVSTLSRLANGPYRLWMFGGGILSVFIGLMLAPTITRQRIGRRRVTSVIESKAAMDEFTSGDSSPPDASGRDKRSKSFGGKRSSPSKSPVLSEVKTAQAPIAACAPVRDTAPAGEAALARGGDLQSSIHGMDESDTLHAAIESDPAIDRVELTTASSPDVDQESADDEVIARLNAAERDRVDQSQNDADTDAANGLVLIDGDEQDLSDQQHEESSDDESSYELRADSPDADDGEGDDDEDDDETDPPFSSRFNR